jgi:2-methylcitrate dehydratase PrpD
MKEAQPPQVTEALVSELTALEAEALDDSTLGKAALCFLDYLSCCFAGHRFSWAQQAIAAVSGWPSPSGAPIVGTDVRVAPPEAAYANSVLAVSASRTDMHPAITSHVGPVAFPAALACACMRPLSGAEFLAACVAGYEAEGRVGRVLVTDRFMRHHRATSVLGSIGGAVVSAKVLGLSPGEAVHALSISANTASGLMEWAHTGEMDLLYQPANAARAAVSAALLAKQGATSSPSILEGPGGLLAAFGGKDKADRIARPWSDRREIEYVDFKAVPACVFVQAAAFAALQLVEKHGRPRAGEIERVTLRTFGPAIAYPGCDDPGPVRGIQQARMSLQFTVASVLAHGSLGDRNFAEFDEPASTSLTGSVRIVEDEHFTAAYPSRQGAEVEVLLRNGSVQRGRVEDVPPVTTDRVRQRFLESAESVLGEARARALERAVLALPDAASFQPLLDMLAVPLSLPSGA